MIEHVEVAEPVDYVFHLASPASPIDYLRLPLHTLKVGSYGTHNALGLAKRHRARFLLASTSEVYGDPQEHPQTRGLLGPRQPDRPARRLRRGQALRRGPDDGLPPPAGRGHPHRADLQHLRPAHAPPRRAGDPDLHPPGARRTSRSRSSARASRRARSASSRTWSRASLRLIRLATATSRSTSATRASSPSWSWPRRSSSSPAAASEIVYEALPRTTPPQRRPDITLARELLGWEPTIELEEGLRHDPARGMGAEVPLRRLSASPSRRTGPRQALRRVHRGRRHRSARRAGRVLRLPRARTAPARPPRCACSPASPRATRGAGGARARSATRAAAR